MPCKIWTGALTPDGYPRKIYKGNENTRYHRVIYCEAHGLELTDIQGLVIRHTCDTPACINEKHLIVGSRKDNQIDMARRGRQGKQKLKLSDVKNILHSKKRNVELARDYGVDPRTISSIRTGKRWNWLHRG